MLADDDHWRMMAVLDISEEAAVQQAAHVARNVTLFGAGEFDVVQLVLSVTGSIDPLAASLSESVGAEQVWCDVPDRGAAFSDDLRLFPSKRLALELFSGDVAAEPETELKTEYRIGSPTASHLADRAVNAGDDGADGNHRARADDDAKHGKKAAHFLFPDRDKRHSDGGPDCG